MKLVAMIGSLLSMDFLSRFWLEFFAEEIGEMLAEMGYFLVVGLYFVWGLVVMTSYFV